MTAKRKKVDNGHPEFPEYSRRFWALVEEMDKEIDALPIKPGMLDGPQVSVCKKMCKENQGITEGICFPFC